jgi:hypothetical protein
LLPNAKLTTAPVTNAEPFTEIVVVELRAANEDGFRELKTGAPRMVVVAPRIAIVTAGLPETVELSSTTL